MKIPTKFRINTDDFKVFFDNNKKTHVCENVETGEKTNIGVLGILMQMGVLKPVEENRGMDERIKFLSEKIESLENKIDEVMNKNINIPIRERREVKENFEEQIEEEPEKEVEEKPKSEINKRIMKKVMEQTEEKEEPVKEDVKEEEEEEEEENDAVVESDEEIDNWMRI
jgi:hypothetical protein